VRHSRPGDLQRPIHGPVPAGFQVQVELGLPGGQPRRRRGPQRGQFRLVVRRSDVLDLA